MQKNLANVMHQVCNDHVPVIITRNKAPSVVMITLGDYQALQETAYLLRAPKNAKLPTDGLPETRKWPTQFLSFILNKRHIDS